MANDKQKRFFKIHKGLLDGTLLCPFITASMHASMFAKCDSFYNSLFYKWQVRDITWTLL